MNLRRFALVLAICCVALSGCTVKFVYNQLDWLIPWYLDDYLTFTSEQQAILEQRINHQLRWHRETQLPHYAVWLRQVRDDWRDGLSLAKLNSYQVLLQQHWEVLLQQIIPDSAGMLATMTDEQIEALFANMAKANGEYYDEYVAPDTKALRKRRLKRMEKFIKRWLGNITSKQEQLLTSCNERLHLIGEERLAFRRQWQGAFRQLLKRRYEPDFEKLLYRFISTQSRSLPPPYQRKLDANQEISKVCILAMDNLMTSRQRDNLLKNISELADDLDELTQVQS